MKDGFLAAIGNDPTAVVYVRGHGSPGQRSITSKYTPPGGSELVNDALDMEEVCRRLLESGLSKTFVGTVKFYSCYSATVLAPADFQMKKADAERINAFQTEQVKQGVYKPSQIKLRELPSEKSAAKVGATYLRKKGMKHCIFYGYLGPLASEYSDDPNDFDDPTVVVPGSQSHKHVKLDDQLIGRNVTGTGSVRARDGRVQV